MSDSESCKYRKSYFKKIKRFAHSCKCSDIDYMISLLHHLLPIFRYGFCRIPAAYRFPIPHSDLEIIERYKKSLFSNNERILPSVIGATSRKKQKIRTVGKTARIISVFPSYGNMLFQMVTLHRPDLIIEMGTALGISTTYLALALPEVEVITMEGNTQYADIARQKFAEYNISNITLLNARFEDILPNLKPGPEKRILVFIDGNHTFTATLEYFEFFHHLPNQNLILIFDDINWSLEMVNAWKWIKMKAVRYRQINSFRCGILIRGY